jgi:hypothetical protein
MKMKRQRGKGRSSEMSFLVRGGNWETTDSKCQNDVDCKSNFELENEKGRQRFK